RRVDVAAGQGRAPGPSELHGQVDGAVGVVRVIDRHVDLPEHGGLLAGHFGRHRDHRSSKSGARLPCSTPSSATTVPVTPFVGPTTSAWEGLCCPHTSVFWRTARGSPAGRAPPHWRRPVPTPP